ncbi:hypothetical protein V8J82_00170 [Gymnodinialimonas sp. 2305UL16-5]|uniref:hypothetical protein n=1 Tax=Gymnodinialimonas mytili TaxID=3126503 RepID=UPI0030A96EE5
MRVFAKALRQPFLELEFMASGVSVEVIERPGLWMAPDRLQALSADLRRIASLTLAAGELTYGVFSGDPARMAASTITLVRDPQTRRPIGFNALVHLQTQPGNQRVEVIHLGLVMVDPNVQSKGLSWILYGLTCMLLFLRAGLRPCYISNVTQVPAVVGMVSETFSEVVPTPQTPVPQDFRKILIAREIMAHHRHVFGVGAEAEFDDSDFIIRNAYTGGSDDLKKSFEIAPKHREARYNEWCKAVLDYERGDDVLQIGLLDLSAAQRYVSRSVPRRSLAGLALLGLILVLQRAIVPALQWFNPSRDFGRLQSR